MLSCSQGLERSLPWLLCVPAAGLSLAAVSGGFMAGPVAQLSMVTAQHGPLVAQGPGSLVVVLLLLLLLLLLDADRRLQSLWFCLLSLGEDNDREGAPGCGL